MVRKRRKRKSPNTAETRSAGTGSSAASSSVTPAADTGSAAAQTATMVAEPEASTAAKQQEMSESAEKPKKKSRTRRTRRPKMVPHEAPPQENEAASQEHTEEPPSSVTETTQPSAAMELPADASSEPATAADPAAPKDAAATEGRDRKITELEPSAEPGETSDAEATATAEERPDTTRTEQAAAAETFAVEASGSAAEDSQQTASNEPSKTDGPVALDAAIEPTQPTDAQPTDAQPTDAQPTDAESTDAESTDFRPDVREPSNAESADTKCEDAESAESGPAVEPRTELQDDAFAELASQPNATAASPGASSDLRVTEGRLVAMLEIVNQLLAEQRGGASPQANAAPGAHAEIVDQLRQRAIELDRREAAMQARLRDLHAREDLLRYHDDRLQQREQEWVRQSTDLTARRRELAARLRQHRHLERAEQSLVNQTTQMSSMVGEVVGAFQQESTQVREVLFDAVAAIQQTVSDAHSASSDVQQQLEEKESEVAQLQEQLEQTRRSLEQNEEELRSLREASDQYLCESLFNASEDGEQSSLAAQVQSLQAELDAANERVEELQSQNGDLASKVVSSQVTNRLTNDGTQSLESLPWEERKRLILARLEDEESNLESQAQQQGEPVAAEVRSELETLRELVQQTDREIMRRDAEIAELRQLLEQQSGTVGEVAIGAAAIAGMLDQDELIREEREKLQSVKAEWEEKLREAEIEVSMERAKLARERQELEKRNAELEEMLAHQQREQQAETTDADGKPVRRRWLARMGLSEE